MKKAARSVLWILACLPLNAISQERTQDELKKGFNFIETRVYSIQEDARILKLFDGLRVADVSDGMDMVGLPRAGLVDPAIHADWLDPKDLSHQLRGIAVTARYVPTQRPDRPGSGQKFQDWESHFYNAYSHEAFTKLIRPGSVVVLDDVEDSSMLRRGLPCIHLKYGVDIAVNVGTSMLFLPMKSGLTEWLIFGIIDISKFKM